MFVVVMDTVYEQRDLKVTATKTVFLPLFIIRAMLGLAQKSG